MQEYGNYLHAKGIPVQCHSCKPPFKMIIILIAYTLLFGSRSILIILMMYLQFLLNSYKKQELAFHSLKLEFDRREWLLFMRFLI